jgi:hypothetical protein
MSTFTIHTKQNAVSVDADFWKRAFNYAARELHIEHLRAEVACLFIPMDLERKIKFKGGFSLGAAGLLTDGAMFYVVSSTELSSTGRMLKTFFHELTHVKQLLMLELILKPRHLEWKGEKWDKREYAFAPWEVEANTFADKACAEFMKREVNRVMKDESVRAYHPSVIALYRMFPQEEVLRLTQDVHKEREKQALLSSGRGRDQKDKKRKYNSLNESAKEHGF